jgi:predicted pore-forming effector associated with SMODS systems
MTRPDQDDVEVYEPPSTTYIANAQNTTPGLRLLVAQRKLYRRAKRWSFLRTIGIGVIAVAAPIVTAINPKLAETVASVAYIWVFLARTLFSAREHAHSSKGADVQEQFDLLVYSMPKLALRSPSVRPEEVSDLVGTDANALATARNEKLTDWYPIDRDLEGVASIAIAQRANAMYSKRLLDVNANYWMGLTVAWTIIAVTIGVLLHLSFTEFLLGVAIPLLPAMLDVYEQWRAIRSAGRERQAIADGIDKLVREEDGRSVSSEDLLVWQDQLYSLRRRSPQVPNLLYWRTRKRNELAMHAAASELAAAAKQNSLRRTSREEPQ